jgi:tetraacyldisaccharide 4'-kinase
MAAIESYYRELAEGKRHGLFDRLLLALLAILALPYELFMRLRARAYAAGFLTVRRLGRPVISVGNLTVGGTGKTPAVAMLAKYFISRGRKVAVLSRGYGGSLRGRNGVVSDGRALLLTAAEAGDEPCLLAAAVPGLSVVVGADRYLAGTLAMERLDPDLFILDDGYQHQRLHRDLDILLLDGRQPFGNGRTLPRGLLREPASAAERADIIIFTRCSDGDETPPFPGKPVCRSFHHLTGVSPLRGGEVRPLASLRDVRCAAFAGIANPAAFFHDLEEEGLTLVAALQFPDHSRYGEAELREIRHAALAGSADVILTTEKDAVKLDKCSPLTENIQIVSMEMWVADPGPLLTFLEKLL